MRRSDQPPRSSRHGSRPSAATSITYGYGVTWFRKRQREIQADLESLGVTFDPGCWSFQLDAELVNADAPGAATSPAKAW